MSAREEVERAFVSVTGLRSGPSRHGDGSSYFVGQREVAHFHGDARLDIRLTSEHIRERKAARGFDERVTTRGPAAQWISVRLQGSHDLPLVLELLEEAVRANA